MSRLRSRRLRYGQTTQPDPRNPLNTIVTGRCYVTGKPHSVSVPTKGLTEWLNGVLIGDAMPAVNKDDREFLLSGTSPEGWEKMFGS